MTTKTWWWQEKQLDQTIAGTFEGGGLKGHAFTGALSAIVESGRWFHAVSGASAGAAASALIAAGLPPNTGRQFLEQLAPRYLSANWWQAIINLGTTGGVFRQNEIMVAYEMLMQNNIRSTRTTPPNHTPPTHYNDIFGDHPMDDCHPITFSELFTATRIELHIFVTNTSHARPMVFNYKTAPDISVTQAVFASAALPVAFVPPLVTHSDHIERMETVVDGGVWSNMPRFVYEAPYRDGVQLPPLPENVQPIGFLLSAHTESDNDHAAWLKQASFERRPKQRKHWRIFPRNSQAALNTRLGWANRAIILITLLAIPALSIPLAALYDIIISWLGSWLEYGRTTIPLAITAASIAIGTIALWYGIRKQTNGGWGYVVAASFLTCIFALSILFVDSHHLIHQFTDGLPTSGTAITIVITAVIFIVQLAALTNKRTWMIKPLIPILFTIGTTSLALILFLTGYLVTDMFNDALWERIVSILLISVFFLTMFYSYLTILSAAPLRYLIIALRYLFSIAGSPNRATKNEPTIIPLPIPPNVSTVSVTWRGIRLDIPKRDIDKMVDDGRAITRIRLSQIFNTPPQEKPSRTVGVFGSGGVRGVAYIGAIEEMERRNIQFDAVAGVGAGALMATFIAAGYRSDELHELIGRFLTRITDQPLKITLGWFISYLFGNGNWSIVNTNDLIQTINRKLAEKIDTDTDTDITFSMLHAATNTELNILAIDLTHYELITFNHINTPNCQVADAILASYAYPLLISPPLLTTTLPNADLPHRLLFDGSIAEMLPTFIFDQLDKTYNNHIYAFTLLAPDTAGSSDFYSDHNAYRMARFNDIAFHYTVDPDPKKNQYPYEWGERETDGRRWKPIQALRGRWPDPEQWTHPAPPPISARFFDAAAIASKLFQQIFHPAALIPIALLTLLIGTVIINACLPHDTVILNAILNTDWQFTRLMRLPFTLLFIATAAIIAGALTLLFTLARLIRMVMFSFGRTFGYGARLQWWEAADTPTKTVFTIHTGDISPFGFDGMNADELQATIASGRASVQSRSENLHIF